MSDVKIITVIPEALQDAPAAVGEAIAQMMSETDGAFGIVLIGSREDAQRFAELNLFHFGDPEELDRD